MDKAVFLGIILLIIALSVYSFNQYFSNVGNAFASRAPISDGSGSVAGCEIKAGYPGCSIICYGAYTCGGAKCDVTDGNPTCSNN